MKVLENTVFMVQAEIKLSEKFNTSTVSATLPVILESGDSPEDALACYLPRLQHALRGHAKHELDVILGREGTSPQPSPWKGEGARKDAQIAAEVEALTIPLAQPTSDYLPLAPSSREGNPLTLHTEADVARARIAARRSAPSWKADECPNCQSPFCDGCGQVVNSQIGGLRCA